MNNKSRWLSLIVLCTGFLLIVVDMTIVNVALPSIQRDLGFSQSGLAWVINAYLIAFGGLLLLAGRLGDLFGRKRVYLAGLAIFVGASLLCGLSFSQPMLIAARFVQGIGGAVSSAVILAMIVTLFPKPDEQAKAFGVFSFVASAGAAIGLLAGGLITQAVSWHWIFFVNLPIGIATAIAAARLLDSDRGIGIGKGADALGAFLVTAALMLGVYTIVESSDYGLGSAHTLGFGAASLALLGAFAARQAFGRNPILPLRMFAQALGRQRRASPDVVGLPRLLLPRIPRPRAGPWLRPDGHRPGVPARGDRDGPVLAPAVGAADQQVRPACDPGRGAARDCGRACHARPGADQCRLCDVPTGAASTAWVGRRALVPGPDHHRDVGDFAKRRWAGFRPAEHIGAGGRCSRACGPRHPGRRPNAESG